MPPLPISIRAIGDNHIHCIHNFPQLLITKAQLPLSKPGTITTTTLTSLNTLNHLNGTTSMLSENTTCSFLHTQEHPLAPSPVGIPGVTVLGFFKVVFMVTATYIVALIVIAIFVSLCMSVYETCLLSTGAVDMETEGLKVSEDKEKEEYPGLGVRAVEV
ncbi:hypothetical protein EJ05DRAFT_502416 [Pseudovirgaria hyperparasitica]|uniref:Uncharacterized protein n=1 Tax=Pseudovirgaria hyperparasitica TaxID=470096 RepID=A0A6A6W0A7_9PEZI|nr:uncharacterized protein EJ05DRAFT_502416 [Pseudovirgaria hyperparasitica]KAF2755945.1 hypothetical protein EJ05DRAFT_502416 [Pseudovirgaria hyperparasitica]